ncbi:MAG TPA: galactokinase [Sediminibacterium sp.]
MKHTLESFFKSKYQLPPAIIVRSPGRVNIIGEHTDYNGGFVLPAAIDKAAYIAVSLRDDTQINLTALDLNETYVTTVSDIKPAVEVNWPNYILGAAAQFIKRGIPLPGFNAVLTSDVPMGAGLSSSAAVECATVFALNELLHTDIERIEMVNMAQKAEHEYAGVLCGIMDQFASMMGKEDQVIQLDCRSLNYEYVPFQLEGIKIVLLNTNVKHSLASSAYNTRRMECMQAVSWIREQYPQVTSLRDADLAMLATCVLPKSELIYKRSRFIVDEINRLLTACTCLQEGNMDALGKNMFATHDGLSKQYEVSCKELDFLVDFVRQRPEVIGARMMGGGFGGCTINLVKASAIDSLLTDIQPAYESAMGLKLDYYIASIKNGTEIV